VSVSIGVPLWGNMKGHFFLMTFLRDIQMPSKRVSLSIGVLLRNLEGILFWGFLRERKSISGFLFFGLRGY
jgi:hypothetical protein